MRPGPIEPKKASKLRQRNTAPPARSATGADAGKVAREDVEFDAIRPTSKQRAKLRPTATEGPFPAPLD